MKRQKLAEAGFFYSKEKAGDCVVCFVCGVELRNFRGDVNLWVAHHIASKNCSLVKYKKSADWLTAKGANAELIRHDPEVEKRYATTVWCREGIIVFKSSDLKKDESGAGCSSATKVAREDTDDDDSSFICSICLTERVEVLFRPCMHLITCSGCSRKIKQCCHCRKEITKYERVFF